MRKPAGQGIASATVTGLVLLALLVVPAVSGADATWASDRDDGARSATAKTRQDSRVERSNVSAASVLRQRFLEIMRLIRDTDEDQGFNFQKGLSDDPDPIDSNERSSDDDDRRGQIPDTDSSKDESTGRTLQHFGTGRN